MKRLLGSAYPDVLWEDLPVVVAALDPKYSGRTDAIARLGGPFVQVMEYTTLPEASRMLGEVVVAAPVDGTPFDVTATWILLRGAATDRRIRSITGAQEDQILECPFAFDGSPQPLAWEVEVEVGWAGETVLHRHRSEPLCPGIPAWRIAVFDPQAISPSPSQASDSTGRYTQQLAWKSYALDPTSMAALTDIFRVELHEMHTASQARNVPLRAYAVTNIDSLVDQEVRIAYGKLGAGRCWLNGGQVKEASPGAAPPVLLPPPLGEDAQVTVPVRLRAGINTLLLEVAPGAGAPSWEFAVTAGFLDPKGAVATTSRFGSGVRNHESGESGIGSRNQELGP